MKKNKKGFTLVELLVVIAILAILATVSVIGYTGFIEKANLSNDQTTIEMINENLAAASAAKKPATAGEAIGMLYKLGIYGEKLTAYSNGFKYVYNLPENKFYLVDKDNKIVYPKAVDVSGDFWALYTDKPADKIEGFTNYVATGSIVNQTALNTVFTSGLNYNFDLQKSGCLAGTVGSFVTVVDGIVMPNSGASKGGDGVKEMPKAEIVAGTTEYTGKIVELNEATDETSAKFTDCIVLVPTTAARPEISNGAVFENCTFVCNESWAIDVLGAATIKNCTFVNCARGINIVAYGGEVVIEGNVFNMPTTNPKANCIQIAGVETGFSDSFSLTVKNNTFASANAAVVVHESCAKEGSLINVGSLTGKVTFSGNTFGELTNGKVVKDPDYSGTGLDALYNFFNGLVK